MKPGQSQDQSQLKWIADFIWNIADDRLRDVYVRGKYRDVILVRRQNIWHRSRRKLAECGPRPGVDIKRRSCGGASGDVRWSSV